MRLPKKRLEVDRRLGIKVWYIGTGQQSGSLGQQDVQLGLSTCSSDGNLMIIQQVIIAGIFNEVLLLFYEGLRYAFRDAVRSTLGEQ